MKEINIKDKLKELGHPVDQLSFGDFDQIGHFTAYKSRSPDSELFKTKCCFFRPNYERGMLIYSLIRRYNVKSYLEIGFGRGYSSICAAKAMSEIGGGVVTTIDPFFDYGLWDHLCKIFPNEWTSQFDIVKEKSQDYLSRDTSSYDFIYIDGDHTADAVKQDWENSKEKYEKLLLFDDYHKEQTQTDIECSKVIDQIEDESKELIIMDRRIFQDDRGLSDDQINYGQVLLTKK